MLIKIFKKSLSKKETLKKVWTRKTSKLVKKYENKLLANEFKSDYFGSY